MKCKQLKIKLLQFRAKELNPEMKREIEQHLQTCYTCKTVLQQFDDVDRFLASKSDIQPNLYFLTNVRAKIRETKSGLPAFTGKLLFPAYIAAGLAIGAFLGITAGKAVMTPSPLQGNAELGSYYAKADVFNTLPKRSLSAEYTKYSDVKPSQIGEVK